MVFQDFKEQILQEVEKCPSCWRKGQAVFNVIDEFFGVARLVQFEDGIDCFYDDKNIDDFIQRSWIHYHSLMSS